MIADHNMLGASSIDPWTNQAPYRSCSWSVSTFRLHPAGRSPFNSSILRTNGWECSWTGDGDLSATVAELPWRWDGHDNSMAGKPSCFVAPGGRLGHLHHRIVFAGLHATLKQVAGLMSTVHQRLWFETVTGNPLSLLNMLKWGYCDLASLNKHSTIMNHEPLGNKPFSVVDYHHQQPVMMISLLGTVT